MYWAGNAKLLDNNLKCKSDPVLPGKKKNQKPTTIKMCQAHFEMSIQNQKSLS